MSDLIASLDRALQAADSEDVVLRRRAGEGDSEIFVSVTCRARIDRGDTSDHPAGKRLSLYKIIMSPTQINQAQWPGGTLPVPPPLDLDPRIPRENDTDDLVFRGMTRVITRCDPKFVRGELVRIELQCVA
ncbi:hypothetical protein ACQR1Y_12200 [Bradyrhizobium sp. HKCCYLRH3099]|uniref:hypothetical protein n=1 Tax=unclassified Bradyrhizobium TaxID=2631580 RepID=UPI003EB81775